VRVQPLRFGETDRGRGERRKARRVATDERSALQEIENPETGGKARAAGGWKNMVGPRNVVADRLGSVAAEKNRSRMMDPLGQRVGLVERELEMLGRDPVDQRRRLVPIGDNQNGAVMLTVARTSPGCKNISAKTSFSPIQVRLPENAGYTLTARTSFGRINSELPITTVGQVGGDSLTGKIGNGACTLSLTNTNGNIEILKLGK